MKVYTFYSFKGGVGRTALMLHLGVHWAERGRVVALVDMDLHAPGLSYHPWLGQPDKNNEYHKLGVSDLLATFYETRDLESRSFKFFPPSRCLREVKLDGKGDKWGSNGRLLVLPAGDVTLPQLGVVQDATAVSIPSATESPDETLEQRAMRAFARKFVQDLSDYRLPDHPRKAGIDYLLIDCRTGYPELAELAMGYMADRLVLVSGLNQQNLRGLSITLKKLRPRRIPLGTYVSEVVVAFSPVPAHIFEDAEGLASLEEGLRVLENNRLKSGGDESDEALPPFFTLPYSPHLAVSDHPISRSLLLGKIVHPYWESVEKIAETLDPKETPRESSQDIYRQAREIGLELTPRGIGPEHIPTEGSSFPRIATPLRGACAPMWRLPKWHWPLAGDQSQIDRWLDKIPIDEDLKDLREQLLDGLCASISLTVEEKEKIIENWGQLSQFQVNSLVKIFQEEKLKFSAMPIRHGNSMLSTLFPHQQAWAEFMLGKKQGRDAFLLRPLHDEQLFSSWKSYSHYWNLLADAMKKEPDFQDRAILAEDKAAEIAMNNPWESFAILNNSSRIKHETILKMLDVVLSQPFPDDSEICQILTDTMIRYYSGNAEIINKIQPVVSHFIHLSSNSDEAHHLHGRYLLSIKKYQEAKEAFQQALALNETNFQVFDRLGDLLVEHFGQYEEAESAYRQCIEINKNYIHAWIGLGNLLQNHLYRYQESEEAYRQAISIDPKYVHAWNGLGLLYWNRLMKCQKALNSFSDSLEVDLNFAYGAMNRGHLKLMLGQEWQSDLIIALSAFEKENDPDSIVNRTCLSIELNSESQLPSETELTNALSRRQQSSELHLAIAMRELAFQRNIQLELEQVASLLVSNDEYLWYIKIWHQLSGARPDLREEARKAAAFFFHLPQEHLSRFKDVPRPQELERYRPFVEGRSYGAGDANFLYLFCEDAPPPSGSSPDID